MLLEHNKGLIVTSGCADSHLSCTLLGGKGIEKGDERAAVQVLLHYKRIFGDRFYLEAQRFPELQRCKDLNEKFEEWSKKYKIPLVGTCDVHYPYKSQNELQQALHAANRGHAVGDSDWNYDVLLTYPESDKEMLASLRETGLSKSGASQALAISAEIAGRCNVTLPKMERVKYPISEKDFAPWGMPKPFRDPVKTAT
jgi:DNA polymerase-3 subunit alpha